VNDAEYRCTASALHQGGQLDANQLEIWQTTRDHVASLVSDVVLISCKGRFRSMIELSRVWLLDTLSDTRTSLFQATHSLAAASLTIDIDVGQRMNVRSSRECDREEGVARSHSQRHARSHRDEGLDREYATSSLLSLFLKRMHQY